MLFCLYVRQHFTFSDFWNVSKSIVVKEKIIVHAGGGLIGHVKICTAIKLKSG